MRRPWRCPLALLVLAHAATACSEPRPFRHGSGLCDACHGSEANAAPPRSLLGETSPTAVEVGAHQLHLRDTEIRRAIDCSECHRVPSRVEDPGHIDERHATLTWGILATAKGRLAPSWDRGAATCASTYCHGSTLRGGSRKTPVWTYATEPSFDGPPAQVCAACHGWPPPAPHPTSTSCQGCHPLSVRADGTIDVAGGHHIDGKLDVSGNLPCTACHGDASRQPTSVNPALPAAPPLGTAGESSPGQPAVGAHQAHLVDGPLARAVSCTECHRVPTDLSHVDGTVELVWGSLARTGGAAPAWNGSTCASTYCHGNFKNGNTGFAPAWTGTGQAACGTCHGLPPGGTHPSSTACGGCHPGYTTSSVDLGLHVNGRVDFGGSGTGCASCHGAPPATGAHLAHYGDASNPPLTTTYGDARILEDYQPSGAAHYMFGCGNCHPIDPARHFDGTVEVELSSPAAPAGSLKAQNPSSAAYAGNGGACSNVYCHSNGQESPAFVASPGWTSGAKLGCTGCHDNPPRYPSGGAGTATANTHLVLADDGYELGHFAGLPGPWHTSKHGGGAWGPGQDAAPITCQTCHYGTVDPTNTGPSGFYYLDTGGNYQLPGGRLDYSCTATCHTGAAGKPPTGTGKVLPLRHVNGKREVVFDPRTTLPPIAWLPAAPNTPTRPYWATSAPPGYDPPTSGYDGTTWSLALGSAGGAPAAGYDPSTRTCSNVACHLSESRPPYPLVWGTTPVGNATCNNCHRF